MIEIEVTIPGPIKCLVVLIACFPVFESHEHQNKGGMNLNRK